MREVRVLLENKLNIVLPPGTEVHHIDFNRSNNDLENIIVLKRSVHRKFHSDARRWGREFYSNRRGFVAWLRAKKISKQFLIFASPKRWETLKKKGVI